MNFINCYIIIVVIIKKYFEYKIKFWLILVQLQVTIIDLHLAPDNKSSNLISLFEFVNN